MKSFVSKYPSGVQNLIGWEKESSMPLTCSVLIPTIGRDADPIHTIQGLLDQTVQPDEIIVIDQNSPSLPVLDEYLTTVPRVRHLKFRTPGLPLNSNRGLFAAKGDIIIYVDDDVKIPRNFVEAHLKNYDDASIHGVAGRVCQAHGDPDPKTIRRTGEFSRFSGQVTAGFNALERKPSLFGQGANMSFRKSALQKIGGFDSGFAGNAYFGESDAGLRFHAAGFRMVFDPQAELLHLMAPRGGCRVPDKTAHTFWFVRNGIRLYRRHAPAALHPFFALKMLGYVGAKAAYNRDFRIFSRGLTAMREGWTQNLSFKPYTPDADPEFKP